MRLKRVSLPVIVSVLMMSSSCPYRAGCVGPHGAVVAHPH
jgi:hypothetical protein